MSGYVRILDNRFQKATLVLGEWIPKVGLVNITCLFGCVLIRNDSDTLPAPLYLEPEYFQDEKKIKQLSAKPEFSDNDSQQQTLGGT